jgi:hypothetical protein
MASATSAILLFINRSRSVQADFEGKVTLQQPKVKAMLRSL